MGIHVRMDELEGYEVPMESVIQHADAKRYIVAKEDSGGNPHYHMYLDTEKSKNDLRNYITRKFPEWKKDKKCVKQWGDTEKDLWYFCKGDKVTHRVDIPKTSFSFDKIMEWNQQYWTNYTPHEATMTETLVESCRSRGIRDSHEVIKEFIRMRMGKDGICPFKHGPIIRSAWLALNGESEVWDMTEQMHAKIFSF